MGISEELLKQFAVMTNDNGSKSKDTIIYGTAKKREGRTYVEIDGSGFLTPAISMTSVDDNDRVMVSIINHTATITGNMSSPAASGRQFEFLDGQVIENLQAINARIENLDVDHLRATVAEIEKAYIDEARVEKLIANKAYITEADIERLTADYAKINDLEANYAKIDYLEGNYATFNMLESISGRIDDLVSQSITTEYLTANFADINLLNVKEGSIQSYMLGTGVIDDTHIAEASISSSKIKDLSADKITSGRLDASNIEVVNLNASSITAGTITAMQIKEGSINWKSLDESVPQKITEAAIDGIEIGSENLLRNSKTLIFDDYYFIDIGAYVDYARVDESSTW